jgi:regulatory protein
MEQDASSKIMHKAGALLARRAHSRGELREKLAPKWDASQIDAALDRLEQLHLLNDSEYAYNLASHWMRQGGWGPAKVRHLLLRHRVPEGTAETAVERVRQEISDADALEAYLDRRCLTRPLPEKLSSIHKLFMSLRRRGYSSGTVLGVLRRRIPAAAWQNFETGD